MVDFYLYFIATTGFFVLILIFFKNFSKPKGNLITPADAITVIIPFRNEEGNLQLLIESLLSQSKHPASIIFVDDHSSDHSCEIISKNNNFKLIHLPEELTGKKEAIRFAIKNVSTKYCLTIDADTWFGEDFFEQIKIQEGVDMQIRPVLMKSKSLIGHFGKVEHSFFNALNKLLSPVYILSSSGANLLFKKATYDKLNDFESHRHIASGDDHYLLRAFQAGEAKITVSELKPDVVYTESTNSLAEYFDQRIRWLGKTRLKTTAAELFVGFLIMVYFTGGFIAMIYTLLIGEIDLLLILIFGRWLLDSLVFLNYSIPLKDSSYWWWIPFFQFIYPVLFISVLLGSLFFKPKWKGRNT